MKLSEYLERTYVISLRERVDRRAHVTGELARVRLPVTPGRVDFFDAHRVSHAEGFPCTGAHGCFLSHLAVLESAAAQHLGNVLILEDDVAFRPMLTTLESEVVETLTSQPWDIAFLGHCNPTDSVVYRLQPTSRPVRGAHFYAVHGRCIPALAEFMRALLGRPAGHPDGGPMHYDGALYTFLRTHPDRIGLLSEPSLALQSASRSDIAGGRWFDDIEALTGAVQWVRRLKTRWRQREGWGPSSQLEGRRSQPRP